MCVLTIPDIFPEKSEKCDMKTLGFEFLRLIMPSSIPRAHIIQLQKLGASAKKATPSRSLKPSRAIAGLDFHLTVFVLRLLQLVWADKILRRN